LPYAQCEAILGLPLGPGSDCAVMLDACNALELAYFTEGKIRYTFDFSAKGKMYRYVGEKVNIRPWNLPVSHTTCFGTLVEKESGRLVSRSVTFFKLHTTPAFMASLRFS